MYNNTKKIIVALSVLCYSFATAYATDMVTSSGVTAGNVKVTENSTTAANTTVDAGAKVGTFGMQEVKVADLNTLNVTFNKDLLEDTSMFEFLLTSKKDDTKEIALTGITLSAPAELTAKTVDALVAGEEYNLVVVFASDKDGNVIENGVDGMITFKADVAAGETTTSGEVATETPSSDLNAAPASETPLDAATAPTSDVAAGETGSGVTPEAAAGTAEALPQTGPQEMLFLMIALMLGLGVMYSRRKA